MMCFADHSLTCKWPLVAILLVCQSVTAIFAGDPQDAQPTEFAHFLARRGDQLYDGETIFRFLSFNIPNLHNIEDEFGFDGRSAWRWPNEFEIRDALRSIRQMGGRVARSYVLSVRRPEADFGSHVHVRAPGQFNEEAFEVLDAVLQIANEEGVRVIFPLVDNWRWWGGVEQYAAFRGKPADAFWTDPQIREDFKQTIRHVVQRVNTKTNIPYRQDKAIFGWETGNELDAPAEWTRDIAAYLKQLDPNHLVIDGRSLHGVPAWSLDDPAVDVITTHHYPSPEVDMVAEVRQAAAQTRGRKPYFVGEFGFVDINIVRSVVNEIEASHTAGGLLWSLRFHRREGGFYWHSEPSGLGRFKAYHWPGFASGHDYQERAVLQLVSRRARRLAADLEDFEGQLAAPRLLAIRDPAAISWQGSAGAPGYDVQRRITGEGGWETIGANISDAANPYRPLFGDEAVPLDVPVYYRVIAKDGGKASPPSNVVGPLQVRQRTFVDEFPDLRRIVECTGSVTLERSGNARAVEEDLHCVALGPAATIIYESPLVAHDWTLWVFEDRDCPGLSIATSTDGVHFREAKCDRRRREPQGADYEYAYPVSYEGVCREGCRLLRIKNDTSQQVARLSRFQLQSGLRTDAVVPSNGQSEK